MKKIEVLGMGCGKWTQLEDQAKGALKNWG